MKFKVLSAILILSTRLMASEAADVVQENLNWTWTLIAAAMVFFMQAGFAMVEAGFTRAKNTGNIIMKNVMDFSMGIIAFWAVGFAFMFGTGNIIGTTNFFGTGLEGWDWTFFIFQGVFAATAATIVSGAMAERTKFGSYLVASFILTAFIYPVFGHWAWGSLFGKSEGFLEKLGFIDFAGSTVVHSVGGWAAVIIGTIAGILVVYSVLFIDKLKIDDPVGAVSVHGVNGAWGTLAAGIFNSEDLFNISTIGVQALGIVIAFVIAFFGSMLMFKLIKATIGIRVSLEEEIEGLDIGEHGATAYPEFGRSVDIFEGLEKSENLKRAMTLEEGKI